MKYKDKKLGRHRAGTFTGSARQKGMAAKYPGTCDSCFEYIKVGQMIMWFGQGRTYHASCYSKGGRTN